MMSIEMERWRIFFEKSGEDLWTVIDWALTIAAVNYPKELRVRRDGFAEKLFAPSNYPLVSTLGGGGSELRNGPKLEPAEDDEGADHHHHHSHGKEVGVAGHGDLEERSKQEILDIGDRLEKLDESSPEDEFLKYLQLLEHMEISFETLQATGIGKVVNGLRKHPSKRVCAGAKKLVRLWKTVADEWVRSAEGVQGAANNDEDQHEDGELRGDEQTTRLDLPPQSRELLLSSSVSSVTHPSSYHSQPNEDDDMFRCSPVDIQRNVSLANLPSERSNTKLNGYRRIPSQPNSIQEKQEAGNRVGTVKVTFNSSKKPPTRPAKPQSPEDEKLEAAKRRLHEGYQQAANVKKQRTVQVMGLEDVPLERPGNARPGGIINRRAGQTKL